MINIKKAMHLASLLVYRFLLLKEELSLLLSEILFEIVVEEVLPFWREASLDCLSLRFLLRAILSLAHT